MFLPRPPARTSRPAVRPVKKTMFHHHTLNDTMTIDRSRKPTAGTGLRTPLLQQRPLPALLGLLFAAGLVHLPAPAAAGDSTAWTVTGAEALTDGAFEAYDAVEVTKDGTLTMSGGSMLTTTDFTLKGGSVSLTGDGTAAYAAGTTTLAGGTLTLDDGAAFGGLDFTGSGEYVGRLELGPEAELVLRGGALMTMAGLEASGGLIRVEIRGAADWERPMLLEAGDFVVKGDVRVELGAADDLDGDHPGGDGAGGEVVAFRPAAFSANSIRVDEGARLFVRVSQGGVFTWGAAEGLSPSTEIPDLGRLLIASDAAITNRHFFAVGGASAPAAGAPNLFVASGAVLELRGDGAKLKTEAGTWTHFDTGAVIWITSGEERDDDVPATFKLTQADFTEGRVTGLESVVVRVDSSFKEGELYLLEDGTLGVRMESLAFSGPVGDFLNGIYEVRRDVTTPSWYRTLFLSSLTADEVAESVVKLGSAAAAAGTRERLAQKTAGLSFELFDVLDAAELRGSVPKRAQEDAFLRSMPAVMTNIPVIIEAKSGETRTETELPALGFAKTLRTDDTTVQGAFVLGRGDWRVGLFGAFIEHDFRADAPNSRLPLTGSSEAAVVSLFAAHPLWDGRLLLDLAWSEATDSLSVPSARDTLRAEGVKRTLWSAGAAWERTLLAGDAWSVAGRAGLRGWRWEDSEAQWTAVSGKVLKVEESGGGALSASVGLAARTGFDLPSASGFLGDWLPTRVEASLWGDLTGMTGSRPTLTLSLPEVTAARSSLPGPEPKHFRVSAGGSVVVQFPETRFELSGMTSRAGGGIRSHTLSVRATWRFNEL